MHGGYEGSAEFSDTHFVDFKRDRWRLRSLCGPTGTAPSPRAHHSAVYVQAKFLLDDANFVYTFGGQHYMGSRFAFFNDVRRLNLTTMEWEDVTCSGQKPSPRSQCLAFARSGDLFVYGGYDGHSVFADLHRLDLKTRQWTKVKIKGQQPDGLAGLSPHRVHRCRPAGAVVGKRLLLLAEDYAKRATIPYALNLNTLEWSQIPLPRPPPAIASPSAVPLPSAGGLVVAGGAIRPEPDFARPVRSDKDVQSHETERRNLHAWILLPPSCLDWQRERLLWLACYKGDRHSCLLARCPPHIIYHIISYVNAGSFYLKTAR